jgi:predicted porin
MSMDNFSQDPKKSACEPGAFSATARAATARWRSRRIERYLLAGSAVAALFAAEPAAAQTNSAAGPIRLGLGGYFSFYAVSGWQNDGPGHPGANRHNFDIKREAEIWFTGQTKLDNGLIIGVDVQLEAESCTDQIDESYIWFQGNWGRLVLGSENSAAYLLPVGPPTADNRFDSQDPDFRLVSFGASAGDPRITSTGFQSALDTWVPNTSGDSEKITYLTPTIAGFRAGISFTPDNSEEGNVGGQVQAKGGSFAGMPFDNTPTQWSNLVSVGLSYEGKLGPVDLKAGGGYEIGFLEGEKTQTVGGFTSRYSDRNAYGGGANVGFAGFNFGGGYFVDDNGIDCTIVDGVCSGGATQRSWGLGLTYTIGPLSLGTSYLHSARNRDPIGRAERLDRYIAGARYVVGPGIDLRGSLQYYDTKSALSAADTVNDNYGTFLVLGTVLTF